MKIIFAGTPEFAVASLSALIDAGHEILAVYTQPDRPAGRGQQLAQSSVKRAALVHDLKVFQPDTLKNEQEQQQIQVFSADLMAVVAYGLILPLPVLQAPRLGCINVHPSLLPRYRGAAPIQRAIQAGETETGVTLMQMNAGMDTGDRLAEVRCPILATDTSGTLHDHLAQLGADALTRLLEQNPDHWIPEKQDETLATYAHKISREEARVDWREPAVVIARQIRAFNPWPVAFANWNHQSVRLWQARVVADNKLHGKPGEILAANATGLLVATGENHLLLEKIQLPGGRMLAVAEVLNARREAFSVGNLLG